MKGGTICEKHDQILKLAGSIDGATQDEDIREIANDILDVAEKAKEDGIRMEQGLTEKKTRIKDLEAELKAAIKEIHRLGDEIECLEKASRNA